MRPWARRVATSKRVGEIHLILEHTIYRFSQNSKKAMCSVSVARVPSSLILLAIKVDQAWFITFTWLAEPSQGAVWCVKPTETSSPATGRLAMIATFNKVGPMNPMGKAKELVEPFQKAIIVSRNLSRTRKGQVDKCIASSISCLFHYALNTLKTCSYQTGKSEGKGRIVWIPYPNLSCWSCTSCANKFRPPANNSWAISLASESWRKNGWRIWVWFLKVRIDGIGLTVALIKSSRKSQQREEYEKSFCRSTQRKDNEDKRTILWDIYSGSL